MVVNIIFNFLKLLLFKANRTSLPIQHEDEPAQNAKQAELSGAALKNKKKREAKVKQSEPSHQLPASTVSLCSKQL